MFPSFFQRFPRHCLSADCWSAKLAESSISSIQHYLRYTNAFVHSASHSALRKVTWQEGKHHALYSVLIRIFLCAYFNQNLFLLLTPTNSSTEIPWVNPFNWLASALEALKWYLVYLVQSVDVGFVRQFYLIEVRLRFKWNLEPFCLVMRQILHNNSTIFIPCGYVNQGEWFLLSF